MRGQLAFTIVKIRKKDSEVFLKIHVLQNAFLYFCDRGIFIHFGCINFHRICGIPEKKYG